MSGMQGTSHSGRDGSIGGIGGLSPGSPMSPASSARSSGGRSRVPSHHSAGHAIRTGEFIRTESYALLQVDFR